MPILSLPVLGQPETTREPSPLPHELRQGVTHEIQSVMNASYQLFDPQPLADPGHFADILAEQGLAPDTPISMLPYGHRDRIGYETRRLYWWLAWNKDQERFLPPGECAPVDQAGAAKESFPITRIVSFGKCNVACPYCKRDCQFLGEGNLPIVAKPVPLRDLGTLCTGAIQRGEIVRFSGGDPVVYLKQTLALARYFHDAHGSKISIAHNGSGPKWVERLLPYLSSAAIDLKAVPEQMGEVMGIAADRGDTFYRLSLETQRIVSQARIPLNVRTPIFAHTTYEDLLRIARDIRAANDPRYTFWELRLYKPVDGVAWQAPSPDAVQALAERLSAEVPDLWIGVRAKWNVSGMLYVSQGRTQPVGNWQQDAATLETGSGNLPSSPPTHEQPF
ncbi:MAG: radical SAM protein [Candidatus Peribacteraceae bacterium]|nr:radical SAM protein [Candidatus Peribacteraceae bacterium]